MKESGKKPRLIRRREVEHRTGLTRATIYRWMKAGDFPKSIRLAHGVVVWKESDIDEWVKRKIEELGHG